MQNNVLNSDILFINEAALWESLKRTERGTIIVPNVVLQRADAKNHNGRVYPFPVLEREAKKYMELVSERRAVGELDHRDSPVVDLKNASHNILNLRWEGKDLIGDVEVLTTPMGKIVQELLRNGIRVGISSRGLGSVEQRNEADVVQEDFNLLAFDIVSTPSTKGAFLTEATDPHTTSYKINALIIDFFAEIQS